MATQTAQIQEIQEEDLSSKNTIVIDISHLITEDDEPVDNVFSAHQQRLLVEPLYTNVSLWNPEGRSFVANANVGVFISAKNPAIVPDAYLSMDIDLETVDEHGKPIPTNFQEHRSYFVWEMGKVPDVVIEVVSNRKGGEMSRKMREYAKMHIPYYAVFDPFHELGTETFKIYKLTAFSYIPHSDFWMEEIGIGLRLWQGVYESQETEWLRWCDDRGNVIPTGAEKSMLAEAKAEQERIKAEQERIKAEQERERANRLADKLREMGVNPDEI
ncbi:MAG: Uma2 family endonuclease [Candidatus Kapabacteria bacterium]|jgi:hypothetical protein|nr:Uma2 family endonuclease [Candidatus Kapabacteria bacterium]